MGTPARQCHVGKPPMETRLRATDTAADRDCRSFHAYSRRKTSKTCRPRPSFKHELFDELFPRRCKIGDSNFSSEKKIPRGLLMWFYNDRKVLASRFKITLILILIHGIYRIELCRKLFIPWIVEIFRTSEISAFPLKCQLYDNTVKCWIKRTIR